MPLNVTLRRHIASKLVRYEYSTMQFHNSTGGVLLLSCLPSWMVRSVHAYIEAIIPLQPRSQPRLHHRCLRAVLPAQTAPTRIKPPA